MSIYRQLLHENAPHSVIMGDCLYQSFVTHISLLSVVLYEREFIITSTGKGLYSKLQRTMLRKILIANAESLAAFICAVHFRKSNITFTVKCVYSKLQRTMLRKILLANAESIAAFNCAVHFRNLNLFMHFLMRRVIHHLTGPLLTQMMY